MHLHKQTSVHSSSLPQSNESGSLHAVLDSLSVPVLGMDHKYFGPEECSFLKSAVWLTNGPEEAAGWWFLVLFVPVLNFMIDLNLTIRQS